MTDSGRRVPPYDDPVRPKKELKLKTYEYEMPFNYENIVLERIWRGGEFHGVEMNPTNTLCTSGDKHIPGDSITITEEEPIVRVEVIGSACTPPGFIMLEAEPVEGWRRPDEVAETMPTRFRVDGLWGMHLRADQWIRKIDPDTGDTFQPRSPQGYPDRLPARFADQGMAIKSVYREFPLAGMSCAAFAIPPSIQVRVMGGSAVPGWHEDNAPDDVQYSFRTIRVTVVSEQ